MSSTGGRRRPDHTKPTATFKCVVQKLKLLSTANAPKPCPPLDRLMSNSYNFKERDIRIFTQNYNLV